MTPLPNKLRDPGYYATAFNQLLRCIEERTVLNSETVKVLRSQNGVKLTSAPAGKPGEVESKFRGEWDSLYASSYDVEEIVKISNGQEAGTYIAVEAIPANDLTRGPWTGNGWVLIGRVNDQSNWL